MRRAAILIGGAALSACTVPATTTAPVAPGRYPPGSAPAVPAPAATGLLIGASSAELARLLGRPDREVREGDAVKLQFRGGDCVLDAYLYPSARGGGAAVTHVDTRLPDGRDTDRAACVARLQQRPATRRD